jgi:hypothetical protein
MQVDIIGRTVGCRKKNELRCGGGASYIYSIGTAYYRHEMIEASGTGLSTKRMNVVIFSLIYILFTAEKQPNHSRGNS